MKAISGKELCRLLESNGWDLVRVHGSHHLYSKLGHSVLISVPVHPNRPLKKGTLKALLQKADLFDNRT
jgi:predicted RNA binding protein YcfA (HicA-like mRNA interferase family)